MKPARRARNGFDSRYLVYLNNRAAGKGSVKTIGLCDQKTAPLTPKSFIYNRRSYSQAGCLVLACGSKIFSTQLVFQVPRRASRRFLRSLDALCRTDMLLGYRCVGGGFLAEPGNLDLVEAG